MGATHSQISQREFLKLWKQSETIENLTIWENKDSPSQRLQQYLVDWEVNPRTQLLSKLRKNNPFLVNAYVLSQDSGLCECSQNIRKIFLERTPVRLSNVKDIPFPDVIHLYDSVINGYRQLTQIVGPFRVQQDQIAINQRGQIKVWLNTAFEKSQLKSENRCLQPRMVNDIVEVLRNVSDKDGYPAGVPCLPDHMVQSAVPITISQLQNRFACYVNKYAYGQVPMAMACIFQAGGAQKIHQWCRNNHSHGFVGNQTRLPQKLYQKKLKNGFYNPEVVYVRHTLNKSKSFNHNSIQASSLGNPQKQIKKDTQNQGKNGLLKPDEPQCLSLKQDLSKPLVQNISSNNNRPLHSARQIINRDACLSPLKFHGLISHRILTGSRSSNRLNFIPQNPLQSHYLQSIPQNSTHRRINSASKTIAITQNINNRFAQPAQLINRIQPCVNPPVSTVVYAQPLTQPPFMYKNIDKHSIQDQNVPFNQIPDKTQFNQQKNLKAQSFHNNTDNVVNRGFSHSIKISEKSLQLPSNSSIKGINNLSTQNNNNNQQLKNNQLEEFDQNAKVYNGLNSKYAFIVTNKDQSSAQVLTMIKQIKQNGVSNIQEAMGLYRVRNDQNEQEGSSRVVRISTKHSRQSSH